MHRLWRTYNPPSQRFANDLMSQANTEHWELTFQLADHLQRTAGFARCAGARRQDDGGGPKHSDARHIDRIVADYDRLLPQALQVASEVMNKAVKVVEHENHALILRTERIPFYD